jgi:orotate phosphoribosyltransferase
LLLPPVEKQDWQRLLALLRERSFREGKVVLSSGKVSDFYIDCKQTALHAEGALLIGRLFFSLIQEKFPLAQAVGGPTLGADPLVSSVSVVSAIHGAPLHAFIIRKEPKSHGTESWIEGAKNLSDGMNVVILEDVITTGSSTQKSIEKARNIGLKVLGVLALVDRCEGGAAAIDSMGCSFVPMFERSDFVKEDRE